MTTLIPCLLVACLVVTSVSRAAPPIELHLGVSPFLGVPQRQALARQLPELVLDPGRLPGGSRVIFWDGWRLVTVAEISIPVLKFDSIQARAALVVKPLAAVRQWLRAIPEIEPGIPTNSAALKAPEWLFEASGVPASGRRVFILLGSPLYRSPAEPTFDMSEDGRYPSDGHLKLGLHDSVFGLAEKAGRLESAAIHWCYFGEAPWANALHRHSATRFWALFVQGQGGTLATVGGDLPATLAHALQTNLPPVLRAQTDPADEKPVMRSARPRTLPAWLERASELPVTLPAIPPASPAAANPEPATPSTTPESAAQEAAAVPIAVERPPTPTVGHPVAEPPTPPTAVEPVPSATVVSPIPIQTTVGKVGLGIAWDLAGVDLDLYVKAGPQVRELSFQRMATPEGRYFHDWRKANLHLDYEYVELHGSVDIRQVRGWVNYYKGSAARPSGKVCLHYGGRTYVGEFVLAADRGNLAGDFRHRSSSPHWVELDLAGLVDSQPRHHR